MLEDDEPSTSSKASSSKLRKDKDKEVGVKRGSTRKRETTGRDWEDDPDDGPVVKRSRHDDPDYSPSRRERSRTPEDEPMETEEDRTAREERDKESARARDLKERDEFAQRVRDRERDRTKKLVEDRSSRANAGAAAEAAERRRYADDSEARGAAMPSLREHSRREYLTKRELQQMELLRREIQDEEALFRGMRVSKREQQELAYKKEALRLVEERLKIDDKVCKRLFSYSTYADTCSARRLRVTRGLSHRARQD